MKNRGWNLIRLKIWVCIIILGGSLNSHSQTLSGYVKNRRTQGLLHNVNISLPEISRGTVTDSAGCFLLLHIPKGTYTLVISHIGFRKHRQEIVIRDSAAIAIEVALEPAPIPVESIFVSAAVKRTRPEMTFRSEEIDKKNAKDVGELMREIIAFSAIRRGGSCCEPSYRGYGSNRLQILIDGGVKVEGACPNLMDPSTSHVQAEDIEQIEIIKGPNNVRFGPVFGGLININLSKPNPSKEPHLNIQLENTYESNTDGKKSRLMLDGSQGYFDYYASGGLKNFGHYRDGAGRTIQSSFNNYDYFLKLGIRPITHQRIRFSLNKTFQRDVLFPSLPMDAERDNSSIYSIDYQVKRPEAFLNNVNAKFYISMVDHLMSNKNKATYSKVRAVTEADTRTIGGRLEAKLQKDRLYWYTGVDFDHLSMDGFRTRDIQTGPKAGSHFNDIIWPEAEQFRIGGFSQMELFSAFDVNGSVGLRMDWTHSQALKPEEAFRQLYSGDPGSSGRNGLFAFNLNKDIWKDLNLILSYGRGYRSPSLKERYIYLLPIGVDRYDYVGNPFLKPETNYHYELMLEYAQNHRFQMSCFYTVIDDYVSAKIEENISSRSPGVMGVKTFHNIDKALKYGFEAQSLIPVFKEIGIRTSLSYTYGQNLHSNTPLPEMPPMDFVISVIYEKKDRQCWIELWSRSAFKQNRISEAFGESVTPEFTIVNVMSGITLFKHFELGVGVYNIFNHTYYEHLNRRCKDNGLPIYETGRNFIFLLNYKAFTVDC